MDKYRAFISSIIQRVGEIDDPFMAFYLARLISLTPEETIDRQRVAKWGEMGISDQTQAWLTHAAGLAHYRAGDYERALQRLEASAETSWHPELNQLALALVSIKRQDLSKAREYFERAEQWFADKEAAKTDGYYDVQDTDWLEANLLRMEVKQSLAPETD